MDKRNEILANVSGLLTSEFVALDDIITAGSDFGYKPVTINFAINTLVKDGKAEKTADKMVRAIDSFEIAPTSSDTPVSTPAPKTPKSPKTPFGVTEMKRADGSTYNYRRSAFDGPEGKLDAEHEEKKYWIIFFSKMLRDIEDGFEGAKDVAITLTPAPKFSQWSEDFNKYAKNGKLFFRWDNGNGHTEKVIDLIYPSIESMVKAFKEAQKIAKEGVQ